MAERRMFAKSIIDSDAFLEMPMSARLLYYDLAMRADDDGFVNSPKKIMKIVGATNDDMNILIGRRFVLNFDSEIIVIKHWRIHNYIRNDRYKETNYIDEKSMLCLDKNKAYTFKNTGVGIPNGYHWDTQVRLGKDSIGKDSIDKINIEEDDNSCEKNIFDIYQEEIGSLSSRQFEKLNNYSDKLSEDLIIEAIYRTSDANAKSFKYFETIVKDWINKGYKTLGDIKELKRKNRKEVVVPEWLDKTTEKEKSLITDDDRKEYGID